jgi:hypothetical protein
MKRALIVASVGILASTVWAAAANAQANVNLNERYAAPGPIKRGNMCVKDVDSTRGYGIQQPCPAPKAAASASTRTLSARAAAPKAAASASTRALSARAAAPSRKQKVVKHSQ